MSKNKFKIRPTIKAMEVNEQIEFDITQLNSVRAQASELGAMYDRKYTTKMDRERKVVTVIRSS